MNDHPSTTQSIIMDALSTLSSSQLSTLSHSLSSTFHRHNHHLATLLTSPPLFIHTLNHLYSLSLPQKYLLIARHLLSFLRLLTPFFSSPSPSSTSNRVRLCDLDSVLLLLFFCEVRQHHPTILDTHPTHWQKTLQHYKSGSDTILSLSTLTITPYQTLGAYIDLIVKCRRFVGSKGCGNEGKEVATAVETVVALPSMEVPINGLECVICKEEMKHGRDVCQLPCQHLFHWMCVLPWLNKRNTCPCCRFLLPTDDVYGEIERLWDTIVKVGSQHSC